MRIAGSLRIGTFGGSRSRLRRARQAMGVEWAKSSKSLPFAAPFASSCGVASSLRDSQRALVDPDNGLQACVQRS